MIDKINISFTLSIMSIAELPSAPEELEQMTDEQLIAAHQRDEKNAFAIMEKRNHSELFVYLRRYLGNEEAAKDVLQQTFLQVHLKCDTFDPSKKFRPWLYTIATHQAVDWQRRNKRHLMNSLEQEVHFGEDIVMGKDLIQGNELSGEQVMVLEERRQAVRSAVACLPQPMAESLDLIYWKKMKYREAAEQIGIPDGTVKSRLHAGLVQLEKLLDNLKDDC